jgi:hypothetical protein
MSEIRDQVDAMPRVPDARSRTFVADDGQIWHVSERAFSEYDRRRGHSLIFTSDLAVRRVRDYPANWYDLSEQALAALSWGV